MTLHLNHFLPAKMPRRRSTTAFIGLLLGSLLALVLMTPAAQAGTSEPVNISVGDAAGDGRPDLVRLSIEHAEGAAVRVTVRVRNVRTPVSNEMWLYVDGFGNRQHPQYVYALPVNGDGDYRMLRTDGWRVTNNDIGTCGETIRLRFPERRVRLVVFRMPSACFSDDGAKFAVRTGAFDGRDQVGVYDWAPSRRTLSPRFEL